MGLAWLARKPDPARSFQSARCGASISLEVFAHAMRGSIRILQRTLERRLSQLLYITHDAYILYNVYIHMVPEYCWSRALLVPHRRLAVKEPKRSPAWCLYIRHMCRIGPFHEALLWNALDSWLRQPESTTPDTARFRNSFDSATHRVAH